MKNLKFLSILILYYIFFRFFIFLNYIIKRLNSTRIYLSGFITVLILYLLHFCKSYGCSKVFFSSYNPLLKIEILFLRILWEEVYINLELIPLTSEPFSLVYFNRFYRSYGCSKFVFPHTNLY